MTNVRTDLRFAATSAMTAVSGVAAFAGGRHAFGYPLLAAALLLAAKAAVAATQRNQVDVADAVPVTTVADSGAISPGHRGVSERWMRAIGD